MCADRGSAHFFVCNLVLTTYNCFCYTVSMAFEWRTKRKITFFSFFAAIILVVAGIGVYLLLPAPSCTDGRLNQNEELVDCGGPNCAPCLRETADDLIVLWSRYFEVRPGVYDVAALVENVNLTLGSANVPYGIELYDSEGSRIIVHRDSTYTLPNKQFLVFVANVPTGIRVPQRLTFRFEPFTWQLTDEQQLPVIVSRTERDFNRDRPRLIATISNNALLAIKNIDVAVLISDATGNAIAVSEAHVAHVPDTGTADVAFTWPHPFEGTPADVQFFVRQKP